MSSNLLLSQITNHIHDNRQFAEHNERIYDILEGRLLPEIEKSLQMELSDAAFERARKRIPPINVLKRIFRKISSLYVEAPVRVALLPENQPIVDFYKEFLNLDKVMCQANFWYNSQKGTALEPYVHKGMPKLRSLPFHLFTVFSNDFIEPNTMTHFIKMMGTERRKDENSGNPEQFKVIERFFVYSDDEFVAINSEGEMLPEFMEGNPQGVNPIGQIPFVYIPQSDSQLIPFEDTDTIEMAILIPKLLADLNYAIQFQSHSIIYGIDVDDSDLKRNPDAFWSFKTTRSGEEGEDQVKPEIGVIEPKVIAKDVMATIKAELSLFLESRDIRPTSLDGNADNFASGVALMVANMDTRENVNAQKPIFEQAEKEFWRLLGKMHNHWLETGQIDFEAMPNFPKKILTKPLDVSITYAETKVIEDEFNKVNRLVTAVNGKIQSRYDAVRQYKPKWTEAEINEELDRISKDDDFEIDESLFSSSNNEDNES